jgi:hypothetical protein
MASMARTLRMISMALVCLGAASCGGDNLGGGTSNGGGGPVANADNVVSVAVTGGPSGNSINVLYTTVTVCVPGTSTCQTIDNIQVDTGSYGLRLLAPALTLSLPVSTLSNGSAIAECTSFVDGYSWGPVAVVDVQVSGEKASSVPIQLIGDSRYPQVPADCQNSAPTAEDTVTAFGANGILGIGPFAQDCGVFCESNVPEPAIYYACPTSTNCAATTLPLADQVPNPVTMFAADNNGSIISLSSVGSSGAASVTGSLIFGIGTQSNNGLTSSANVVPITTSGTYTGYITTVFNGTTLASSFIDSGSNAYFFNDSSIMQCTGSGFSGFYCPTNPVSLSAQIQGSSLIDISFTVSSAQDIPASDFAFPSVGGTISTSGGFDWGLPFFFGRQVVYAIEGSTTSAGAGPYVAF